MTSLHVHGILNILGTAQSSDWRNKTTSLIVTEEPKYCSISTPQFLRFIPNFLQSLRLNDSFFFFFLKYSCTFTSTFVNNFLRFQCEFPLWTKEIRTISVSLHSWEGETRLKRHLKYLSWIYLTALAVVFTRSVHCIQYAAIQR